MSRPKRQLRLKLTRHKSLVIFVTSKKGYKVKDSHLKPRAPKAVFNRGLLALLVLTLSLHGSLYFGAQAVGVPLKTVSYTQQKPIKVLPKDKFLTKSKPTTLRIPSVKIDTPIKAVELVNDKISIPDPEIAGWYRYSPTPGEAGPAIIVGHVDSFSGPAIFWRLRELKPGDLIEVDRADNLTAQFQVIDIKEFPQESVPLDQVYGNLDYAGLRLITCGGTFNRLNQNYSHNLVIFAKLFG